LRNSCLGWISARLQPLSQITEIEPSEFRIAADRGVTIPGDAEKLERGAVCSATTAFSAVEGKQRISRPVAEIAIALVKIAQTRRITLSRDNACHNG
jgi:hypothetical protein